MPTACACCIAAMLTKAATAVAAVSSTTTRAISSEQAFIGLYTPDSNVDKIAVLDLDQRSIVARLAAEDEEGLTEAENVYSNGRITDTASDLTIKGLSIDASDVLSGSATYQLFVDYYGDPEYADRWVTASFDGKATTLNDAVNVDFSKFDVEGRAGKKHIVATYIRYFIHRHIICTLLSSLSLASIRWGTPLLHVWMYVVGLLERAAFNCQVSGDNMDEAHDEDEMLSKKTAEEDWDKALALYIGSEPRESGKGGFFLYTLTQVECYKFGTCKKGEMAPVNTKIFEKFSNGKLYKDNIVPLS